MFESHLKPPISFPSVSGAVCSFDSQYAGLPLKAHTVAVNAVQASGTPTPVNPLPISGWSAITITANSVPTVISIGSTIYGGNYDAVSGVLTITHGIVDLGSLNWNRYTTQSTNKTYFRTSSEISDCIKSTSVNIPHGLTCSNYVEGAWTNVLDASGYDLNFALGWNNKSYIAIYDTSKSEMTAAEFKTAMNGVQLMYPLATPTIIQLPPCPIDTLEGVNNIWADTGDTTLQYIKLG